MPISLRIVYDVFDYGIAIILPRTNQVTLCWTSSLGDLADFLYACMNTYALTGQSNRTSTGILLSGPATSPGRDVHPDVHEHL